MVQITISKSGVVTIDFDYAYTSAEDYDLTLVSYDGTTFVGENSSLNEQVKLVFQDNGSVDYIYGSEDPVSLSK